MIFGISHIDVPVTDIDRARKLWERGLGAVPRKTGEGFCDMDAHSVMVRLYHTAKVEAPVRIRLQSGDVAASVATLTNAGATLLYAPMRTPDQELVAALKDPDGNTVMIWRELTEDEYEFVPELPKEMTWQPDADALLKSLLLSVPVLFRALARRKVAGNAEYLARTTNLVTKDHVVRAFILSNAKPTRSRVREPLIKHGYNPDEYKEEFDA